MLSNILHNQTPKSPKNGKWKEFNKHAVLVAEGTYYQDLKHGLWKQYYETGELIIEEMYQRGIMHGRYASYYLNGQVMAEGQYVNGSREGYFHVYDETGNRIKSMLFVHDVEIESSEKIVPAHSSN
ncbi:hypothetical protein [Chryseolinea sp. H1M3-3]|jgi:antitoxin component YwqK of YwqJK toxin-antitoxin module|uniref:toxin-antitoxin system YwqK family antitoxin n=1 Tax=Chryseolinea sp. H1M3-3 TaxID=3034144 RepID=UPI0023EDF41F|nr:hypothetical protein [Chryseolinea sp. H1M3-3]